MSEEKDNLFIKGIFSLIEEVGKRQENDKANTHAEELFRKISNEHLSRLETKEISKTIKSEIAILALRDMLDKLPLFMKNPKGGKTFALPTLPVMFALLPLFSGKPSKMPKGLKEILAKPESERTEEEQELVQENIETKIMSEEKQEITSKGTVKSKSYTVFICDSPVVQATAKLADNINVQEETLAAYVNRIFGAEGMRHLMALLVGLEENGRQGKFTLTINDHLERMGYKREKSGSFNSRIKLIASDIIRILGGLSLNSIRPTNKNVRITSQRLFTLVKSDVKFDLNKEIIEGFFEIRAEDWWYSDAFNTIAGEPPKYCKLLSEIILEDHSRHPIAISLLPILGTFWSSSPEAEFTVTRLMDWCNLDYSTPKFGGDKHRLERLRELESELDYMTARGYIGTWKNNQEKRPSLTGEPFECVLTIVAPQWFEEKMNEIEEKKEPVISPQKDQSFTSDELSDLIDKTGLKIEVFSEKLGVSKRTVQYLRSGEKPVSKKLSIKIRETFADFLN
jgi:hypothetical protein